MFKKHSKSYSSLAGINDASRRTKRQTRTAAFNVQFEWYKRTRGFSDYTDDLYE